MPIGSRGRPIGVTVLSLIAFAVSPVFLVLLGIFFYNISQRAYRRRFRMTPVRSIGSVSGGRLPQPVFGIGFLLPSDTGRNMRGAAFCTLGGFFLAYPQRPRILQNFAPPPPDLPRRIFLKFSVASNY